MLNSRFSAFALSSISSRSTAEARLDCRDMRESIVIWRNRPAKSTSAARIRSLRFRAAVFLARSQSILRMLISIPPPFLKELIWNTLAHFQRRNCAPALIFYARQYDEIRPPQLKFCPSSSTFIIAYRAPCQTVFDILFTVFKNSVTDYC